jgi:aldehyde dehydrogenase (NAD+)
MNEQGNVAMTVLPEARLYIDGAVRRAAGGRLYDIVGPWTGDVVGQAADAAREDVDEAIAAARRAFDETDWPVNRARRVELVTRLYDLLVANKGRMSQIARHEGGAALGAAYGHHVEGALTCYADLLRLFPQVKWEEALGTRESYGFESDRRVVYEPIGVVGAITPWNIPFYVGFGKVVSALLAGCTVILKSAPDTPAAGALIGELAAEAGFPPGVLNVISAKDPAQAGEMLVTDPRVDLISFTGSTGVGRRIMELGGATLKRLFLELGGKSANILLDDAPYFAEQVKGALLGYHAGQGCAVWSRLLVPRSRYDEAIAALKEAYAAYEGKWGDFDDPTHVMGPLISKKQLERVMNYIEIGKQEGATLLAGGARRPDKGAGFFVEPTCFVDVRNDMRIAQEEIFGPVLVVIPFEDDEDAIRIANDSVYGLSGAVSSADVDRAMRVVNRLRTGSVGVNYGICIAGDLPFGGVKQSGIGREWGREGIEEYLESKVIAVRR